MYIGYISGVAGLLVGSPLDVLKVRLQIASTTNSRTPMSSSMRTLIEMKRTEGVNIYLNEKL